MDILRDKNIVSRILTELVKVSPIPQEGFLAGGAVSNVLLKIVYGDDYPINDLDIFQEEIRNSSDEYLTTPIRTKDISIVSDGYDGMLRITNDHGSQYQISSVTRDNLLNYINVTRVADRDNLFDFKYILKGFDLNCCQVGINLSTMSLTYTDDFEVFLKTKQLKVTTIYTPCHTAIRLFKKIDELRCYCDIEYNMELLSQPTMYETRKFLRREDFGFFFGEKYKELFFKYFTQLKEYFTFVKFFDYKKEMWFIEKGLENTLDEPPSNSVVHWLDSDRTIPKEYLKKWAELNDKLWTLKPTKYGKPNELFTKVMNSQPIIHSPIVIESVFNIVRGSVKKKLKDKVLKLIEGEGYLTTLVIRDITFCDCDFTTEHIEIIEKYIEDYRYFFPTILKFKLNVQESYELTKSIKTILNQEGDWFGGVVDNSLNKVSIKGQLTYQGLNKLTEFEKENYKDKLTKPTDISGVKLPSDVRVRELVMELDLMWAGRKLRNCIKDPGQQYKEKIESGNTKVFLITTEKSYSALELSYKVDGVFSKQQHLATCNVTPSRYHTIISDILLNALNYERSKTIVDGYKMNYLNGISLLGTVKDETVSKESTNNVAILDLLI